MKEWNREKLASLAETLLSKDEQDRFYPQRGAPMPNMVFVWTEIEWVRIKLLARLTGCRCPHLVLSHSLRGMEVRRQLEGDNCEHPFQDEELAERNTPRIKKFFNHLNRSHEQNDKRKQCHQGAYSFYCYCEEHDHSYL